MYELRLTAMADASTTVVAAALAELPRTRPGWLLWPRWRVRTTLHDTPAGTLITHRVRVHGTGSGAVAELVARPVVLRFVGARDAEAVRRAEARARPYAVGAALLDGAGRVLAAQRAAPERLAGRWELPGGKLEPGETDVTALVRECEEELAVRVTVSGYLCEVPLGSAGRRMRFWAARVVAGDPVAVEHRELRWVTAAELDELDWLEADLPVLDLLRPILLAQS